MVHSLNLPVTTQASRELERVVSKLANYKPSALVNQALADEVQAIIERIDPTLDAELQLCRSFLLTPCRTNLEHLLKMPQELLAPGVFQGLPALVQFDFREAGRCIAFGLATAAAFHLMRTIEGLLREFYCFHVKRDRVKKLMWFDMIDHLRKRPKSSAKALLDNLDNIRTNFRNPTQHPDARYDLETAQDLLFLSMDVLNRMAKGMNNERPGR